MFYYRGYELMAVRQGPWKAHFQTQTGYGQPQPEKHDPPLLFNLLVDPSEKYNLAAGPPDVIAGVEKLVAEHQESMQPAASQLELQRFPNHREPNLFGRARVSHAFDFVEWLLPLTT